MDWKQASKNVWTCSIGKYNVVIYSYETERGESFFWDVFDNEQDRASGASSSLVDAKRLAEQQLRELSDARARVGG